MCPSWVLRVFFMLNSFATNLTTSPCHHFHDSSSKVPITLAHSHRNRTFIVDSVVQIHSVCFYSTFRTSENVLSCRSSTEGVWSRRGSERLRPGSCLSARFFALYYFKKIIAIGNVFIVIVSKFPKLNSLKFEAESYFLQAVHARLARERQSSRSFRSCLLRSEEFAGMTRVAPDGKRACDQPSSPPVSILSVRRALWIALSQVTTSFFEHLLWVPPHFVHLFASWNSETDKNNINQHVR